MIILTPPAQLFQVYKTPILDNIINKWNDDCVISVDSEQCCSAAVAAGDGCAAGHSQQLQIPAFFIQLTPAPIARLDKHKDLRE